MIFSIFIKNQKSTIENLSILMTKRKHVDDSFKSLINKRSKTIPTFNNVPMCVLQNLLLTFCDLQTQHALREVISGSNDHGRVSLAMETLVVFSPNQTICHPEQIKHLSIDCDIDIKWHMFTSLTTLTFQNDIKNSSLKHLPQTLLSVDISFCDNITKVGMKYLKTLKNLTHLSIGAIDDWSRHEVLAYFNEVKNISSSHYETNDCLIGYYMDKYMQNLYLYI
jgi:hypothetical protein